MSQIRRQELSVGQKIPSENELSRAYGVGRPTVRQATETLLRKGYLERRRGSGTYVRQRSRSVDLFSLGGTIVAFGRQGIELSTQWVEFPVRTTVGPDLAHPLSGRDAFRCRRLGRVVGRGVLIETFWFDAELFAGFDQLELEGRSLSELTYFRYGREPSSAEQRFSVERLGRVDAELLACREGEPALRVERTIHFNTARGAVFVEMQCLSDQFAFSQTLGVTGEVASPKTDCGPE